MVNSVRVGLAGKLRLEAVPRVKEGLPAKLGASVGRSEDGRLEVRFWEDPDGTSWSELDYTYGYYHLEIPADRVLYDDVDLVNSSPEFTYTVPDVFVSDPRNKSCVATMPRVLRPPVFRMQHRPTQEQLLEETMQNLACPSPLENTRQDPCCMPAQGSLAETDTRELVRELNRRLRAGAKAMLTGNNLVVTEVIE